MRQLSCLLLLLSTLSFFISCNTTSNENIAAFQSLEETLVTQNQMISWSTTGDFMQLQEKLHDPCSREKANFYFPKVEKIKKLSLQVIVYIDSLKTQLKKSADPSTADSLSEEALKNTKSVNDLLVSGKKGEELYKMLQAYRTAILALHPGLMKEFAKSSTITSVAFERKQNEDFSKFFFHNLSLAAALPVLTKFQANVHAIEQKTTKYLNVQVSTCCWVYYTYAPIFTQSSSCVLPGEYIEVITGVGGMVSSSIRHVLINGKEVETGNTGVATARLRASSKPGTYRIPVEIKFVNPNDGLEKTYTKTLKYTVFNKN